MKIKIIIADDHDIYLDGLKQNLNDTDELEVVGTALNGKRLLEGVRQLRPDVVLTDVKMPVMGGVEAIAAIQKMNASVKCLALSTFDNNYLVLDALQAGARGYVLKEAPKEEVLEAVKAVYEGDFYYCSGTTKSLARILKKSSFNPYSVKVNSDLFTLFEKQIIHYVCEERTSAEIAGILHTGVRSIEKHRDKIMKKMKVRNPVGIGIYAVKNNLFPAPEHLLPGR